MTPRPSTQRDYAARINRVIDYIHEHLAASPQLAELARVGCFSPFHFHRVFRAFTGETVHQFVARVRIERAALLLGRAGSRRRLSEVARDCGFSTPAEFSRSFRAHFGTPPSAFRRQPQLSKNPQGTTGAAHYPSQHEHPSAARLLDAQVVSIPERHIAYVRVAHCLAPGRIAGAHSALLAWAQEEGLSVASVLGLSHDDPAVTPEHLCRYDVACTVPATIRGRGDIAVRRLPAGMYVEIKARGAMPQIEQAWDRLFSHWLPSSGFEPADGPGIERFLGDPNLLTWENLDVVLSLPICRARK